MAYEIRPIQPVPDAIVEAVNNGTLAVFVGAGVSRIIGCKSWDQLARNLVNKCYTTINKNGKPCINFREKETLLQMKNNKKVITLCRRILENNGVEDHFFEEFEESLKADEDLKKRLNIYHELWGLRGVFITTNADTHFHDKFNKDRIVYDPNHFDADNIDNTKLYHLHGLITNRSSLVFTVSEYIRRYNEEKFENFLKKIFGKYTVLFVGYGLEEFEVLDFVLRKFDKNKQRSERHFIILDFFKGEESLFQLEQAYYSEMEITVIPYEKDEKGYEQLYELIKSWNKEINDISRHLQSSFQVIEDVIDNYQEENIGRIFQIIRNDKPQENYFFKTLASATNPFPWLKHLKQRGYFDPSRNPVPQEVEDQKGYFRVPSWNILGFLENVAEKNAENPSSEITDVVVDIVNSIIDYKDDKGQRIENYRTDRAIVKIIFHLPQEISGEHIEFLRTCLTSSWGSMLIPMEINETILPRLISAKAKNLLLKVLDVILDYRKEKGTFGYNYFSIMDDYWLNEAIKRYKREIAKLCGIEAADVAIKKMKALIHEDKHEFGKIWIPTIEDHPETTFKDKYEIQLVRFVRDIYELSKSEEIKDTISKLREEQHPIFKRIAIHTINRHYNELNNLLWNWPGNPIEEHGLKHELYELLRANCSVFSEEQIKQVLRWIRSADYSMRKDLDKVERESLEARLKKEWVSALWDTNHPEVRALYEECNKINPVAIPHPGFDVWSEKIEGTPSPVGWDKLIEKSNEEIANDLINFKEEEGWKSPTKEGLSEAFRSAVFQKPEKFTDNLQAFLDIPLLYQYKLLWGLCDAWRNERDFLWTNVIDFIHRIVKSDDFWTKTDEEFEHYRPRIAAQIADLIELGTRKDSHAFDPKLLPKAEKILLILADRVLSDVETLDDIVTAVLNSPKGRVFSAIVSYSLKYARLYKNDDKDRWPPAIKQDFDNRLDREVEPSLDFSLTLGKYLLSLAFLDMEWIKNNLDRIFLKGDDKHWRAAFTGYLFYARRIHEELYILLREHGHYNKALEVEFPDSYLRGKLVQHICVSFLNDRENLEDEDSLICRIVNSSNTEDISEIVRFIWTLRGEINEKIRNKIKSLWKSLFENLSKKQDIWHYQKILSDISKWLVFFDEIDGQMLEWLKLSAKYIGASYSTPFFLESLLKHVRREPAKVGELFITMIDNGVYPDYKKEDVQTIVQILYEKGEKRVADTICNSYLSVGLDFLSDIYKNYNPEVS